MQYSLKELRARKNLTQEEIAKKLGIATSSYNFWEKNPGRIKLENALKLSEIFGVPLNEIFFG